MLTIQKLFTSGSNERNKFISFGYNILGYSLLWKKSLDFIAKNVSLHFDVLKHDIDRLKIG